MEIRTLQRIQRVYNVSYKTTPTRSRSHLEVGVLVSVTIVSDDHFSFVVTLSISYLTTSFVSLYISYSLFKYVKTVFIFESSADHNKIAIINTITRNNSRHE